MKRSDRLMALVLHLRVREWVRAEALGREFGVGVRTIYRDVAALNAAGVPVLSAPGQGYRLMDGYFLPPLHFMPQEAVTLAFGLEAVQGAFGAEEAGATQEAARKLGAALPEERRAEVERLRAHVRLIGPDAAEHAPALPDLRAAILAGRSVHFRYHAPGGVSRRHADPLALVRMNGVWMLTAHDHARGERRTFRLDRMEELVTGGAVIHPAPPGLRQPPGERRGLQVQLLFAPGMERWVRGAAQLLPGGRTQRRGWLPADLPGAQRGRSAAVGAVVGGLGAGAGAAGAGRAAEGGGAGAAGGPPLTALLTQGCQCRGAPWGQEATPTKTNLDFIALSTPDLEAARHFYTAVLGFEAASERPGAVILANGGGTDIGLREVQDAPPPAGAALWLNVPDLAACRARLEAGGVAVTPSEPSPFGPMFRLTTPDGHVLTFHQLPQPT